MKHLKSLMTKTLSIIAISIITVIYLALPAQAVTYTYDGGGNMLSVTAIGFDNIAPVTTVKLDGLAGLEGWFRSDVQVTLTAADNPDGSGVVKTEYSFNGNNWTTYSQPLVISTEGPTDIYYRSQDAANNIEVVQKTTVKIDKTAPVIEAETNTPATAFGWNNTDVTVHFTATDELSGIAQITPDIILTEEGAGQPAEGTATDLAGNLAQTSITVNIDKTAPVISGSPATQPNAAGWYNSDVTVKFEGSDSLSGIDTITPDTVISTEGTNQSVTGTVIDKAGNSSSVTIAGINLDKTTPVTTCTPDIQPNNNGWYNTDIQLTLNATDKEGGSGVIKIEYSLDGSNWNSYSIPIIISDEGIRDVYYRSTDLADNLESVNQLTIKLDKTPPVISGIPTTEANPNGWWNTNVTVHFTADDQLSGIQSLTPDTVISTEAAGQFVTGTAVDEADNSASFTVDNINIDKTQPEIIITSPIEGMEYTLNESVIASWSAEDTLSGIETSTGTVPDGSDIDTAAVGRKTFTVETIDKAGNRESITLTYYVRYDFTGLLEPIHEGKVFKGNTVPVKFILTDAQGNSAPDAAASLYLTGPDGCEIEAVSTSNATEGNLFRYDNSDEQYIFNLNTQDLQPGIWELRVELDDGTSKFSTIELGENGGPPEDKLEKEKDKNQDKEEKAIEDNPVNPGIEQPDPAADTVEPVPDETQGNPEGENNSGETQVIPENSGGTEGPTNNGAPEAQPGEPTPTEVSGEGDSTDPDGQLEGEPDNQLDSGTTEDNTDILPDSQETTE